MREYTILHVTLCTRQEMPCSRRGYMILSVVVYICHIAPSSTEGYMICWKCTLCLLCKRQDVPSSKRCCTILLVVLLHVPECVKGHERVHDFTGNALYESENTRQ